MVAKYKPEGHSFIAGKLRRWSDRRIGGTGVVGNYNVASDGKRIAALMPASDEEDRSRNTSPSL
jgi:hypothetical protein